MENTHLNPRNVVFGLAVVSGVSSRPTTPTNTDVPSPGLQLEGQGSAEGLHGMPSNYNGTDVTSSLTSGVNMNRDASLLDHSTGEAVASDISTQGGDDGGAADGDDGQDEPTVSWAPSDTAWIVLASGLAITILGGGVYLNQRQKVRGRPQDLPPSEASNDELSVMSVAGASAPPPFYLPGDAEDPDTTQKGTENNSGRPEEPSLGDSVEDQTLPPHTAEHTASAPSDIVGVPDKVYRSQ